jgi:hypothetical protein
MLRKTRCLLALVLLCGVGQAGVSWAGDGYFIGHLPQGTVELMGITAYPPTNQSRWWQPDGSAVPLGAFYPQAPRRLGGTYERAITFLIRVTSQPADASPSAGDVPPGKPGYSPGRNYRATDDASWPAWGLNNTVPPPASWEGNEVVDGEGNRVPNCRMFSTSLRPGTRRVDFRVGISMGAWETVASRKPDSAGTSSFNCEGRQWKVTFYKAKTVHNATAGDITQVSVATTVTWPAHYGKLTRRLVVVTSDGCERATGEGDYAKQEIDAVFPRLPVSSIQEVRFQVRPYYWVEFKNVSLQSGRKTHVQVVSSDGSVDATK